MQSASLSPSFGSMVWSRTRAAVPPWTLWSAAIVFLLVLVIANSTVAASWVVVGLDIVPWIALGGAAFMALLAVTPLPWYVCVGVGMLLGPVIAGVAAAPAFREFHSADPGGLALVSVWLQRIQDGSAFGENDFVLFVIVWLMWVTGAWLAWCVLRWRQPLIGLIPGAAAFATNVLNYPKDQNGFTLGFVALTFALLLWTTYTASVAKAVRAHMKLTGDAKWDFWESGILVTSALIIIAVLMPPISTVDRTATMESSLFSGWAQLQQALNHPDSNANGTGNGRSGTTGFSTEVVLGGSLTRSTSPVFSYTVAGSYIGPKYFRGVSVIDPINGEWKYDAVVALKETVPKGTTPDYAETYNSPTYATFTVIMANPPGGNKDLLFYPGTFVKADRDATASEIINPEAAAPTSPLDTIDRMSSLHPGTSMGGYSITSEYPNAFASDLQGAGTDYPSWLQPYMRLPKSGYRPAEVLDYETTLAIQITNGMQNAYDKATAIQNYLRSNFRYTLKPGDPPDPTEDRMLYFLQTNKQGYCEYFAMAMGDMLRLLGIPTRLVNGFGPGLYQASLNRNVVTGADAHTWVEVYFPTFGWIPFEPTPDPNYPQLVRGQSDPTKFCPNDTLCGITTPGGGGVLPTPSNREGGRPGGNQTGETGGTGPGGFRLGPPDAGTLTKIIGVLLAVMLLIAVFVSRYLRPRTVMGVWQRTLVLARLAGAAVLPGETPLEAGRRLARLFPEVEGSVRALTRGFAVAAYAPPDLAQETRASVMEAWAQLRPLMLRRVAVRMRPARR